MLSIAFLAKVLTRPRAFANAWFIVVIHDTKKVKSCEAKVLAAGCHGGIDLLPESLVTFVLRKVQFWSFG